MVVNRKINLEEVQKTLNKHKVALFKKYGIKRLGIFGSVSRGDNTEKSDVDILVEFNHKIGIEFIDLADELEALLKVKIDLVSRKGIKPRYFRIIEEDLFYV